MVENHSNSNLEPFLLMAKSMKGGAAVKVIDDAIGATGLYGYGDLLDMPNIQELKSDPSSSKSHAKLRLFAYGSYEDYLASPESYGDLSANQLGKLRQLTLVSMGLENKSLPYDQLLRKLSLNSIRELENLVIECIYSGGLKGKLDQKNAVLHVDAVIGRDVDPEKSEGSGSVNELGRLLQNWCTTADALISSIDQRIQAARQSAASEARARHEYAQARNAKADEVAADQRQKKLSRRPDLGAVNDRLGSDLSGSQMDWTDSTGGKSNSARSNQGQARRKLGQRSSVEDVEGDEGAARQKPRRTGEEAVKRRPARI